MADIERALISKVLKDGCIARIADARIQPEHLADETHAAALAWIFQYWHKFGKSPTRRAFRRKYPQDEYRLIAVPEPIEWLISEVRNRRGHAILNDAIYDAVQLMGNSEGFDTFEEARQILERGISTAAIETSPTNDMDVGATYKKRLADYADRRNNPGGLRGVTTGFSHLDRATGGFMPEQLITFVGQPKVGKSSLLMYMAMKAQESGVPVLFIGYEMSNVEQYERHDSLAAGVSLTRLQRGAIDDEEQEQLRKALRRRKGMAPFTLVADPTGTSTISGVRAKIEQYQPGIVFVDGVYLMEDEVGHEPPMTPRHLTNLTRGFKRMAQSMRIPILETTQVLEWKLRGKSKAITGDSIGFSSGFIMDSDLIIGAEGQPDHEDTDPEGVQYRQMRIVMGRNARQSVVRFTINWRNGEVIEAEMENYVGDEEKASESMLAVGLSASSGDLYAN